MIRPWSRLQSIPLGDFTVFRLRKDLKRSPRTGRTHEFYVMDSVDWVNVVALTPDRQVVLVEQYRHGTDSVELEIPGGLMDPGETDPVQTAVRELREETGYTGVRARLIGEVLPNPAIQSNRTYTVLVEDCRCTHPVQFDQGEDIVTRLMPMDELPRLVASGRIRHCVVVAALYHFDLWQRGLKPTAADPVRSDVQGPDRCTPTSSSGGGFGEG
jgi:8-oxo-dGTP pyrophosphatase MutT (NUDIX family)